MEPTHYKQFPSTFTRNCAYLSSLKIPHFIHQKHANKQNRARWVGSCFPSPAGDGSYNWLNFSFTAENWTLNYVANGDDICTVPFMTVHIEEPYTLEEASEIVEGARNGTFGFTTKTVTPHMEDAVDIVNGACGTDADGLNEPYDHEDWLCWFQ